MLFEQTFVINLDRSPQAYQEFVRHVEPFGLRVERVPAVDGRDLQPQNQLSPFQVACSKSHARVIANSIRRYRSILVLEDDARFCQDLHWRLRHLEQHLPTDWEHVYLGGFGMNRANMSHAAGHVYTSVRTNGAHAYILRACAYERTIHRLIRFTETTDGTFGDMIEASELRSYTFLPICAYQDEPRFSEINQFHVNYNSRQYFVEKLAKDSESS